MSHTQSVIQGRANQAGQARQVSRTGQENTSLIATIQQMEDNLANLAIDAQIDYLPKLPHDIVMEIMARAGYQTMSAMNSPGLRDQTVIASRLDDINKRLEDSEIRIFPERGRTNAPVEYIFMPLYGKNIYIAYNEYPVSSTVGVTPISKEVFGSSSSVQAQDVRRILRFFDRFADPEVSAILAQYPRHLQGLITHSVEMAAKLKTKLRSAMNMAIITSDQDASTPAQRPPRLQQTGGNTVASLRRVAKKAGVVGYSQLTKQELSLVITRARVRLPA